jgi:hypothetical protein
MVGEPSHVKQLLLNHVCKIGLKRRWVLKEIKSTETFLICMILG